MFRRLQMLKKGIETIKKVAPKTKLSETTKKFKERVQAVDRGLDKGIKDFKKDNPKSLVSDDQMKKIRKDKKIELTGKETKSFLREKKFLGGRIKKKKPETKEKKSIKEKILPKKKKDRLEELRKELGMKKGGSALKPVDKEKNPGLAKLPTQVRNKMGYMKKGGQVKKFGGGKK